MRLRKCAWIVPALCALLVGGCALTPRGELVPAGAATATAAALDPTATSAPALTPSPAPTLAIILSATPIPSVSPVATRTPVSPATPAVAATAVVSVTPASSATPAAVASPAVSATVAATALANVPPTPTPPCLVMPVRGFGQVWDENAAARELVGCATSSAERPMKYEAQRFERGVIFWTDNPPVDARFIYVLFSDDNTYIKVPTSWQDGQPESTVTPSTAVPSGKLEPTGKLGQAWREGPRVRERLGFALDKSSSGDGAYQELQRGLMFWVAYGAGTPAEERRVYALGVYRPTPPGGLRNDWREFTDTWKP